MSIKKLSKQYTKTLLVFCGIPTEQIFCIDRTFIPPPPFIFYLWFMQGKYVLIFCWCYIWFWAAPLFDLIGNIIYWWLYQLFHLNILCCEVSCETLMGNFYLSRVYVEEVYYIESSFLKEIVNKEKKQCSRYFCHWSYVLVISSWFVIIDIISLK